MTLIKNSIKLLAIMFCVGVVTQNNWYAFSLSALNDFYVHKQSDWINSSSLPMYLWTSSDSSSYCWSVSPFAWRSSWSSMGCWKSRVSLWFNSFQKWMVMRMNCSSTDTSCMLYWISNVRYTKNSDNYKFEWYNNQARALQSLTTPKDSYTYNDITYDSVLFWHNSVIFWNTWSNDTLQYMPWVTYHNWILISNPFIDDVSVPNLYFIKLNKNQARGTRVSVARAWQIMQWDEILSDEDIYEIFGPSNKSNVKFYNISRNWSHFWPNETQLKYNQSDSILSSHSTQVTEWFIYLPTLEEFYPWSDLPSWDNWNNWSSIDDYYSSSLIKWYNECWNKAENLRKYLTLFWYCTWQEDNYPQLPSNILHTNWSYNYTWDNYYCTQLADFHNNIYNLYSWNWNNWVLNQDVDLYDIMNNNFNDLIISWWNNGITYDLNNWHMDNLPSVNNVCSVYNVVNIQQNEKSRVEKAWESITNFFWSWVTNNYYNSIKNWLGFSWMIDSISEGTSWYFNSRFFSPYINEFNNWRFTFSNVVNVPQCSIIKESVWVYSWWNIALFWFSAVLLLILLTLI